MESDLVNSNANDLGTLSMGGSFRAVNCILLNGSLGAAASEVQAI